MEFIEYSLESLKEESRRLAQIVKDDGYRPDCVAYLARGGWLIGKAVAEYLDVPLIEFSTHRSGETAKKYSSFLLSALPKRVKKTLREREIKKRLKKDSDNVQKNTIHITTRYQKPANVRQILLVDDSADTGASLLYAALLCKKLFPEAEQRIAVLNKFKTANKLIDINYCLHENCLLSTPASKDNKEYKAFNELYMADVSNRNK